MNCLQHQSEMVGAFHFEGGKQMAKIIFTSSYTKDTPPAHLENYVRYISTREGVDKIDESKSHLSASKSQKRLIKQLLQDITKANELLEYKDIPAWIDFWGYDVNHDWDWWQVQFPYFVERVI